MERFVLQRCVARLKTFSLDALENNDLFVGRFIFAVLGPAAAHRVPKNAAAHGVHVAAVKY